MQENVIDRIKEYFAAERKRMGWLGRRLAPLNSLKLTRLLSHPVEQAMPSVVLRPSTGFKIYGFFLLFMMAFCGLYVVGALLRSEVPVAGALVLLVIFALPFGFVLRNVVTPCFNYHIRINATSIAARGKAWPWSTIEETAIHTQYRKVRLLLFFYDGVMEVMDITRFELADDELAGIIEYYKQAGTGIEQ